MATEYLELISWNKGRKCKVAAGPWSEIRKKMEGAEKNARRMAEADAVPHLVLVCGLTAWIAFMVTVLPFC